MLNRFGNEIRNAPIGTVGAICGIASFALSVGTGILPIELGKTGGSTAALLMTISLGITYSISFILAKILDARRSSSALIYAFVGIITALIINTALATEFGQTYHVSIISEIIGFLLGFSLSLIFWLVYSENNKNYWAEEKLENIGRSAFYVAVMVVQSFIIPHRLFFDVNILS